MAYSRKFDPAYGQILPVDTSWPGRNYALVTPNNDNDITPFPRAFWVGTGGTLALVGIDEVGNTGTVIPGIPDGTYWAGGARRVLSTGTTASGIVAIY